MSGVNRLSSKKSVSIYVCEICRSCERECRCSNSAAVDRLHSDVHHTLQLHHTPYVRTVLVSHFSLLSPRPTLSVDVRPSVCLSPTQMLNLHSRDGATAVVARSAVKVAFGTGRRCLLVMNDNATTYLLRSMVSEHNPIIIYNPTCSWHH